MKTFVYKVVSTEIEEEEGHRARSDRVKKKTIKQHRKKTNLGGMCLIYAGRRGYGGKGLSFSFPLCCFLLVCLLQIMKLALFVNRLLCPLEQRTQQAKEINK